MTSKENRNRTLARCRERNILLPTFAQLRDPEKIPSNIVNRLTNIGLDDLHPLNLFRINWFNDPQTGIPGKPNFLEIPPEITGVPVRVIGLVGKFFPTGAHKVGATYGCLVPALVSGSFNPDQHKAVWPSTGNYCRGGVFNSALLGVHSVAILPEEMSRERFQWLEEKGAEIFATPGCESNVKEIYDKCHELEAESPDYHIFNQFSEFGNAAWHYEVTGPTIEKVFGQIGFPGQELAGFVSATGSAGTIAAGDYLRAKFPAVKVVASEALQCPTMLMNGFGGHRIEGIGDKHIPWIHNIRNTDLVCAIDDQDAMDLLRLFNEPAGHEWLSKQGVPETLLEKLQWLGISSIANLLSAIKMARYFEWNEKQIIFTVFTDSAEMYQSRLIEMNQSQGAYSQSSAGVNWNTAIGRQGTDNLLELTHVQRKRIHNLKYFTWVEQQGKHVDELNAQWYEDDYWTERLNVGEKWDELIEDFNQESGVKIN